MNALHIRTGDAAAAFLFDAWLERHSLEIERAPDELDACVRMLLSPEKMPDLILVGALSTSEDQQLLLQYLNETWPGALILLYGPSPASLESNTSPLLLKIESQARRNEILSSNPLDLIEKQSTAAAALELIADNPDASIAASPRITDEPDRVLQSRPRRRDQVRSGAA